MQAVFRLWDKVFEGSPLLGLTGFLHFLLFAVFLFTGQWCEQMWLGNSIWLKPAKFALSISLYCWTLSALFSVYPYSIRQKRFLARLTSFFLFTEIILISLQAFRGTGSHFNISTPFDAMVFNIMGIAIGLNFLIVLLLTVDAFRLQLRCKPYMRAAIQIGWLAMVIASVVGLIMSTNLQHSVDFVDGGEGLPFLQWNLKGGDLRVAHFIGLHGIQVLPLIALSLPSRWPISRSSLIIYSLGAIYLLWTLFLLIQALMGRPFLSL